MADEEEKPCPCSWLDKAKAISLVIAALTTSVASIAAAVLGAMNHERIDDVRNVQGVQVERASEVRETLERQTESTDAKLVKIEKSTAAAREAIGPQLWTAYKYAESISDFDPTPENLAKTKEAKAAYENYLKKK